MAADTTTELNRGTERAAPAAAEGERSGLARWAMVVAVAALVVAVASPVGVPMLRTAPQAAPDPAVSAAIAAAEQAARAARDTADQAVPLAVRIDVLEQAVQKLAAANATAVASPDIRRLALAGGGICRPCGGRGARPVGVATRPEWRSPVRPLPLVSGGDRRTPLCGGLPAPASGEGGGRDDASAGPRR